MHLPNWKVITLQTVGYKTTVWTRVLFSRIPGGGQVLRVNLLWREWREGGESWPRSKGTGVFLETNEQSKLPRNKLISVCTPRL